MGHDWVSKLNFLVIQCPDGNERVCLTIALMESLFDKLLTDSVSGGYFIESPLLFHHVAGKQFLPVKIVTERELIQVLDENMRALRSSPPAFLPEVLCPTGNNR